MKKDVLWELFRDTGEPAVWLWHRAENAAGKDASPAQREEKASDGRRGEPPASWE